MTFESLCLMKIISKNVLVREINFIYCTSTSEDRFYDRSETYTRAMKPSITSFYYHKSGGAGMLLNSRNYEPFTGLIIYLFGFSSIVTLFSLLVRGWVEKYAKDGATMLSFANYYP